MSEHYWADGTLTGELETLLYGPVGGLLQKWQRKAIRKAMKQVDKVAEASDTSAIEAAVEPYKPLISAGMYQFLSDVVTSAGLLRHGKTDKGLSERISASAMMFMGVVAALSAKEAP